MHSACSWARVSGNENGQTWFSVKSRAVPPRAGCSRVRLLIRRRTCYQVKCLGGRRTLFRSLVHFQIHQPLGRGVGDRSDGEIGGHGSTEDRRAVVAHPPSTSMVCPVTAAASLAGNSTAVWVGVASAVLVVISFRRGAAAITRSVSVNRAANAGAPRGARTRMADDPATLHGTREVVQTSAITGSALRRCRSR